MTAIYFILSLVLFYYVFKFSMRLLLPYALKKFTERMMKKAQQGQGGFTYTYGTGAPFGHQNTNAQQEQRNTNKSDGQLKVEYVPQVEERGKGAQTAGEFIDFEEVK
ncbi:DUF4834 family protein [Sphingobacterium rhinopitheci]|uniref:DUF4834 family protein n=1 Tax=Sphingobacterium rhinopitheci TaxID=2781960 RepID=UPI00374DF9FD|nr:DUF4834 family protein [Sphingobacterium rhinopitheci]